MRILPLLLAVAVTLPACTMTSGQKKTGIAVGVLTAIAGAAAIGYASSVPCQKDPDFVTGVGCVAGSLELTAAGAVLAGVGLIVLGVLMEDVDSNALMNFQSDYEMSYPVVRGTAQIDAAYGRPKNYPTTFIFDRNGHLVFGEPGGLSERKLLSIVEPLI